MSTTTKIANLLLSEEQANKDLAFSLIESLGVDFGEVCEEIRKALILKCDTIAKDEVFNLVIMRHKISLEHSICCKYIMARVEKIYMVGSFLKWKLLSTNLWLEDNPHPHITFFIQKIKQAYNETKQSHNYGQ